MMLGVILFERDLDFNPSFVFLTIFFVLVYRCLGMFLMVEGKSIDFSYNDVKCGRIHVTLNVIGWRFFLSQSNFV